MTSFERRISGDNNVYYLLRLGYIYPNCTEPSKFYLEGDVEMCGYGPKNSNHGNKVITCIQSRLDQTNPNHRLYLSKLDEVYKFIITTIAVKSKKDGIKYVIGNPDEDNSIFNPCEGVKIPFSLWKRDENSPETQSLFYQLKTGSSIATNIGSINGEKYGVSDLRGKKITFIPLVDFSEIFISKEKAHINMKLMSMLIVKTEENKEKTYDYQQETREMLLSFSSY